MKIKKYNRALSFYIADWTDQAICERLKVKPATLQKWKRTYKFQEKKLEWLETKGDKNPLKARFGNFNSLGNKGNRTENRGRPFKLRGNNPTEWNLHFLAIAAENEALQNKTFIELLNKNQKRILRNNAQSLVNFLDQK